MREVSRFRLSDGTVVNMEVGADDALDRGYRDVSGTYEARTSLRDATRSIGAAMADMVRSFLEASGPRPNELAIECSVQLSAESGATIVKSPEDGHFHIKATWDRTTAY
ncbi:CU044_2847 family protein [Streptomyces sp. NPDC051018]|uniref:CU044_2847 family protein n=1 Tax=Streptomyces sp. NPDC051018 TaxID=3365639 RepID=UPI0037AD5987